MKYFCCFLFVVAFTSCYAPKLPEREFVSVGKQAVIFVPGFKGSALVDGEGQQVWFTLGRAVFGSGRVVLDGEKLRLEGVSEVIPAGVLKKIDFLPPVYNFDVYGSFLEELQSKMPEGVKLVEFAYDFRKSNAESAKELSEVVTELRDEGFSNIAIVAHSMGGLIASYYLRYGASEVGAEETWEGAKNISKVVLMGVPFRGAMTAFRDMQYGSTNGLNSSVFDNLSLSSFESVYELLPIAGEDNVIADSGVVLSAVVGDSSYWRRFRWGLMNEDGIGSATLRVREEYTRENLLRARALYSALHAPSEASRPESLRVLNVVGSGAETLSRAILKKDGILHFENEGEANLFVDGDGTVPRQSAALPLSFSQTFTCQEIVTNASHEVLFLDKEVKKRIFDFLFSQNNLLF